MAPIHDALRWFDLDQLLPGGFRFPARMTAIRADGKLALISPIPIDDALADTLGAWGEPTLLIAPNLLHHLYLGAASSRFGEAAVVAPRALRSKRPDLRIDLDLEDGLPPPFDAALTVLPIGGAPKLGEFAFFHAESATLVVTDLVFNVTQPIGVMANVVLTLVGCRGTLAQSRAVRWLTISDRDAAALSVRRLLALPFERLVVAHGDVVVEEARPALARALAGLTGGPSAIAAPPA